MKMLKIKRLFLLLGTLSLFQAPVILRGEVVEKIVALVNNEVITLSELEEMGRPVYEEVMKKSPPPEREQKLKEAHRAVLETLVEGKLLEQEIKKRKIEVPARDVDATIAEIMKSSRLSQNDLKKALAQQGMTYSSYRQKVRDELGKMRLVNREIKSKIVIEEERVRRVYQENLDRFTDPLQVKIQQIFLPVPANATQEEVAGIQKEAQSILERARKGEDFSELARKYSRGPEARDGGILGYFKEKELMPKLEGAGFGLKKGEVSDLVKTHFGFHILKVLDRKGGEPRPFAEVQSQIREEMIQAEAEKKYEEWMKELKSKSYIEIRWKESGDHSSQDEKRSRIEFLNDPHGK
jgi:peptidyl-prolyl cis-trans isomerase SurA